jgi:hypothetical protein
LSQNGLVKSAQHQRAGRLGGRAAARAKRAARLPKVLLTVRPGMRCPECGVIDYRAERGVDGELTGRRVCRMCGRRWRPSEEGG